MLKPNKLRRRLADGDERPRSPDLEPVSPLTTPPASPHSDPVTTALAPMIAQAAVTVPALLTPQQTAEALGVGTKTLERWRSQGEGPRFVKLSPGTVRYRAADLNVFVAERIRSNTFQ